MAVSLDRQGDAGYASIVAVKGLSRTGLPILEDAAAGLDGVRWVDTVDAISRVLGYYRHYMSWVVALSYFAVYGLLYPRYRGATWRVLVPTALASIATLALLGIAGQSLQLFHVLALMLYSGSASIMGFFSRNMASVAIPLPGLPWCFPL